MLPKIPPTLVQFFRYFDDVLLHQHFPNRFPLVLDKARTFVVPSSPGMCLLLLLLQRDSPQPVTLKPQPKQQVRIEAVPTEDLPCIDIWDAANEKVYSSANAPPASMEWQEGESGVYRDIRARLLGDFVLICRFGGKYARDDDDPSKILFRYVGNTAFLVRDATCVACVWTAARHISPPHHPTERGPRPSEHEAARHDEALRRRLRGGVFRV